MAFKARGFLAVFAIVAVASAVIAGCGPKPPCEVSPAQVDAAREACVKATKALEDARAERSALEAELAGVRAEIAELEGQPAELAERLDALKKGSGR